MRNYTICILVLLAGLSMGSDVRAENFQDFPAMCVDGNGNVFVSYINRQLGKNPELIVASWDQEHGLHTLTTVASDEMIAFDAPALAASEEGCLLVFSVETRGKWQIGYLPITTGKKTAKPRFLACKGTVNAKPAVTSAGERYCIVWESNADGKRGIYYCWLKSGRLGASKLLSARGITSCNPAVVGLDGGKVYAAWDAFHGEQWNIYGRSLSEEKMQQEEQISSDARIERHAALASGSDGEVWIAWEATASNETRINHYEEHKIVVVKRTENVFEMPVDLFGDKGPQSGDFACQRPVITLDASGRLFLSFRKNDKLHDGEKVLVGSFWHPEVWTYAGTSWFNSAMDKTDWGWWRSIPIQTLKSGEMVSAVQEGIGLTYLLADRSASKVVIEKSWIEAPAEVAETTALVMPKTDFSLPAYIQKYSLRLPRQSVRHNGKKLTLYWGDLHEHTAMSQCARLFNPPACDLFLNQRDIDGLDFTALTDHGYNHCDRTWAYTRELVRASYDPGSFIPLLGIEWTSDPYGHHNLIFQEPSVSAIYRRDFQGKSPLELYEHLAENEASNFIGIPHGLSDSSREQRQTDWSQVHEVHQPLAEIFQARMSYEHHGCPRESATAKAKPERARGFYLQDAWLDEIIIGTSASPDHGGTTGRTGVWAADLSPENLFDAFHKRHTFGTSGAKIALYFASGGNLMGDKVWRGNGSKRPITFDIKVVTDRSISKVVIFRNNKIVHEIAGTGNTLELSWTDKTPPSDERLWYYVRVERADNELAWSSPIWFLSATEMRKEPTHTLARPKKDILDDLEKP